MALSDSQQMFQDNVARATGRAPDNYPEWDTGGYAAHRATLLETWAKLRGQVIEDEEKVAAIEAKLTKALASFDLGESQPGQSLMFEIYNLLDLGPLR